MNDMKFLVRVLEIFSMSHANAYGDLLWFVDEGGVRLFVNVNDTFAYGADGEAITPDTLPDLEKAYADLKEVGGESFTATLYTARRRKMRPLPVAYPGETEPAEFAVAALLDACGSERTDPDSQL